MKRAKLLIVATLAVSLLTTSIAFAAPAEKVEPVQAAASATQTVTPKSQEKISVTKAKSTYWKKVPKSTLKYIKLTTEDGFEVYKGKGVKGDYVYSFEIDAYTGKFREYDRDLEKSRSTAGKIGSKVYKADVKAKVLKKVPKAVIIYIQLTRDDGRWIYEGEAYRNGYEYSFEMNAYSGRFIEWEKDRV